jgi:hypothetical protein
MLIPRNLKNILLEAASDTPVVMLIGARQTGKSTLMKGLFHGADEPFYVTLDDLATLSAARMAPQSFIEGLPERVIIDEIQRAPELLLPIKRSVDQNRAPGRFFLTVSANVLTLPKVADSLAGRMEIHNLWPVSQGEIRGKREAFIDSVFSGHKFAQHKRKIALSELIETMTRGGFPDVLKRESFARRKNWMSSYITTLIERDVRDLRNVEQLTVFPRLLALLAARSGGLSNNSELSRSLGVQLTTLKTYISLLEALFLVVPLQPWFSNVGKRLVKSPKIYINDTGLLCHLIGSSSTALSNDGPLLGHVFENFIVMEIMKQIGWSEAQPKMYHFRTESGQEVDIVLERADGKIVGIECKSSSSIDTNTFKGLKALKELTGKKFHRGIVLYTGSSNLSVGDGLEALHVSALWETTSGAAPKLSL